MILGEMCSLCLISHIELPRPSVDAKVKHSGECLFLQGGRIPIFANLAYQKRKHFIAYPKTFAIFTWGLLSSMEKALLEAKFEIGFGFV